MARDIKNVAASVRQQLLNRAHAKSRPFNELLQHYAMERFLYRLAQSAHVDRFVLKGALMMLVWQVPVSRPTMDIDLLGFVDNDVDTIVWRDPGNLRPASRGRWHGSSIRAPLKAAGSPRMPSITECAFGFAGISAQPGC
jgi:hypothetical protein